MIKRRGDVKILIRNLRKKAERISSDGVLFKCSNCDYEPEMEGNKDDLLKMNFCPNCGRKFKNCL